MTKMMFSTLCAVAVMTSASAQENSDVMLSNGIKYLDVPYVAQTLELAGPEELIINCDEVDCTTFVEYVLAESLSPTEEGQVAEGDFAVNLQKIRYRNGEIDGYPSRLHYISDWINNGVRHGFLEDVTASKSSDTEKLSISYMSSNPQQYKQLANSTENLAKIKEIEKSLTGQTIKYLPKEKLPNNGMAYIKNGDIIAITTNTPGLDVAHMGIAFYVDGKLTLLHASSTDKKVVVSKLALPQMLKENSKWTGIRVLRMKK